MQSIKIYPPAQLLDKNLSEQKFEAWQTELEVWLGEDDDMARFMGNGIYREWTSAEVLSNRIAAISANDVEGADLGKHRRQLKMFLSQVTKVVSDNHYNTVMRHATSLNSH